MWLLGVFVLVRKGKGIYSRRSWLGGEGDFNVMMFHSEKSWRKRDEKYERF